MNRIKKVFMLVHIVLWTLLGLLVVAQLRGEDNPHWPRLSLGFILTGLYVFYTHFALQTRYSGKKKKGAYFLRLAAIIVTGPFPYMVFHYRRPVTPDVFAEHYFMALCSLVIIFLFLSWLARVTENLVLNTVRKEQLEKQAVAAELYYLKSQMAPHFLFNTLNNIHTLVYKQAPAAPGAVMQLASIMRYMIYESNVPTVPLTREIEYLLDYVGLQQLRYKQQHVVDLTIDGDAGSCHVAPLLFIHLLENAYKHSPSGLAAGDIRVRIAVGDGVLTFSVENPVAGKPAHALEEPGGIGLPNVRKRLALLYPDRHRLDIQTRGETFSVVLELPGFQPVPHERKADLLHY